MHLFIFSQKNCMQIKSNFAAFKISHLFFVFLSCALFFLCWWLSFPNLCRFRFKVLLDFPFALFSPIELQICMLFSCDFFLISGKTKFSHIFAHPAFAHASFFMWKWFPLCLRYKRTESGMRKMRRQLWKNERDRTICGKKVKNLQVLNSIFFPIALYCTLFSTR